MIAQTPTTIEPKALTVARPADYVTVVGIGQLAPDDFSIPVLKLLQTNTRIDEADKHAGQWYRSDTGEIISSPRC